MSKKIKLEVTKAQLNALYNVTGEMSASIGMGSEQDDKLRVKWVMLIDRMLKKNGFKRDFN